MRNTVLMLVGCGLVTACARQPDTTYTPLPQEMNAMGARVLGDHLYVYGGHTGAAHDTAIEYILDDFIRLDLTDPDATWEPRAKSGHRVQQASLFSHEGELYRLGGLEPAHREGERESLFSLDDFGRYDVASDSWVDLPAMAQTRASHDVQVANGTLVVTGGWEYADEDWAYVESTLTLDLTDPDASWEVHEQPFQIRDHCGAARGNEVYVLGGMLSGSFPARTWVFDVDTKSYREGPRLPVNHLFRGFGCGATHIGDDVYLTGGDGAVWTLNAAGDDWEKAGELSAPRLFHRLVAYGNEELIAVGGGVGLSVDAIDSVEAFALDSQAD